MLDASCGPSFSLWVLSHGPALGQTCRYSSDGCACMHWLSNKTEQFSRLFLCVYRNRSYFFAHFSLFSMLRSKILSASKCVASSRIYCRMSLVSSALSRHPLRESGLSYFLRSDSESFEVEKAVESEWRALPVWLLISDRSLAFPPD